MHDVELSDLERHKACRDLIIYFESKDEARDSKDIQKHEDCDNWVWKQREVHEDTFY